MARAALSPDWGVSMIAARSAGLWLCFCKVFIRLIAIGAVPMLLSEWCLELPGAAP